VLVGMVLERPIRRRRSKSSPAAGMATWGTSARLTLDVQASAAVAWVVKEAGTVVKERGTVDARALGA